MLWVAVVFCAGFAVMDVLEVAHKLEEEGESTIAVIAAFVAASARSGRP